MGVSMAFKKLVGAGGVMCPSCPYHRTPTHAIKLIPFNVNYYYLFTHCFYLICNSFWNIIIFVKMRSMDERLHECSFQRSSSNLSPIASISPPCALASWLDGVGQQPSGSTDLQVIHEIYLWKTLLVNNLLGLMGYCSNICH